MHEISFRDRNMYGFSKQNIETTIGGDKNKKIGI